MVKTTTMNKKEIFPSAQEDARAAELCPPSAQTLSTAYRLAFRDHDFLLRDELRPVRLQLELLKPELILNEHHIEDTIVIFGSARIPDPESAQDLVASAEAAAAKDPDNMSLSRALGIARRLAEKAKYYGEARRLAAMISQASQVATEIHFVVVTGGGPGIMEAANREAHDAAVESIGLNIVLPFEQKPNPYITPELNFQFHYFAVRKMHFLMRPRCW